MDGRRAQMPMAVARWAVTPFAVPGGIMLDPFAGTAVLCEAAEEAGMRAVGFELDPRKHERLAEPEPLFGEFDLAAYLGEAS